MYSSKHQVEFNKPRHPIQKNVRVSFETGKVRFGYPLRFFFRDDRISQGSHSDWKTWTNEKACFQSGKSQGILNRLEKSAKSQGKSQELLENLGNLRQILFLIFQTYLNEL